MSSHAYKDFSFDASATTMITTRYLFNAIFKLIAQAGIIYCSSTNVSSYSPDELTFSLFSLKGRVHQLHRN